MVCKKNLQTDAFGFTVRNSYTAISLKYTRFTPCPNDYNYYSTFYDKNQQKNASDVVLVLFIERSLKQMFQTSPLLDMFVYLHSAFQNNDNRIVFHNSDILNKSTNCHIVIFRKIKTVGLELIIEFDIQFCKIFFLYIPFLKQRVPLTTVKNVLTIFLISQITLDFNH